MTKGDIIAGLIVGTILVGGGGVCVLGWKAMNEDPYINMRTANRSIIETYPKQFDFFSEI